MEANIQKSSCLGCRKFIVFETLIACGHEVTSVWQAALFVFVKRAKLMV
jgi:hypothetical protein